jgi:ATP-binding cassette subfamily B protein
MEHPAPPINLTFLLARLFRHINRRRRKQFMLMFGLTLAGSLSEVLSLGAVLPFIGVLTQPERVFNNPLLSDVFRKMGMNSPADLIVPLAALFGFATLMTGALRLLLLWFSSRLANATGVDLGIEAYRRTLYQPYPAHVGRSSSEIISNLTQNIGIVINVLNAMVNVATSFVLLLAILCTLIVIDPMVATASMLSFAIGYGIIAWQTRNRLVRNSISIAQEHSQVIKSLQEGLGAIRDVLLDGTQDVYCDMYRRSFQRLQLAFIGNTYINQAPRYVLEVFAIVVLIVLALVTSRQPGGTAAMLPVLGALALGSQRMLPLLQQLYMHWSTVMGSKASFVNALDLLDQPLPEEFFLPAAAPLALERGIQFENVRFRYSGEGPWILNDINMTISKGSRVGFIGSTGSGKSTTLDLLMSLLEPTQGRILIDGKPLNSQLRKAWQRTIAHVPQSIYLTDASIAENIAFGVSANGIDMGRVRKCAAQARISAFIESRPEKYDAVVGERGVRLSGGQRQRIGIARALYKQASILVFDEATSALDSATEQEVMNAIENLDSDLTVLLIAHRLSTLKHCDTIFRLEEGQIAEQGSYEHFMHTMSTSQTVVPVKKVISK